MPLNHVRIFPRGDKRASGFLASTACVLMAMSIVIGCSESTTKRETPPSTAKSTPKAAPIKQYKPRADLDTSGFSMVGSGIKKWSPETSLTQLSAIWDKPGSRAAIEIQRGIQGTEAAQDLVRPILACSMFLSYEGETRTVYDMLSRLRSSVEKDPATSREWLYTIVFYQGVIALRQGENENCIACRGESSCILPLLPAAYHTNAWGSETAIKHFEEYLAVFPSDQDVQWLLNIACMTLGRYPDQMPPKHRMSIDKWGTPSPVGAFREISSEVHLDNLNQSGGGIMEDFDRDGYLDCAVTSINPGVPMTYFRNRGNGTFTNVSSEANVLAQLGGLYCVQADYNNDGFVDIFIPRGAWFLSPIRPTLLRNEGDGTWTDVTQESGLLDPVNSNSACWSDFDRDGDLDIFVCCERQRNRLFRNNGAGGFTAAPENMFEGGLESAYCKGAVWIDIDNDGWQDLFLNNLQGPAQLFRNITGSHFSDVTKEMGIRGPETGFACWAWDYDNNGWLDIFATSYDRNIGDVVAHMINPPTRPLSSRLWQNSGHGKFRDRSADAGISGFFETMGCNFGDIDDDGWLDFYLGTGDPQIATLIPNRMFHNREGNRFSEITAASRTGSLQKGHSVSFADWDRNGVLDVFSQMGGAIPGDQYHNLLFQNPGTENHSITLQLHGTQGNRSAIGARIRVVTGGESERVTHSLVTTGSSFGANPLEVHIGTGSSESIELLEIQWPHDGSVQTFHSFEADQFLTVIEGRDHLIPTKLPTICIPAE